MRTHADLLVDFNTEKDKIDLSQMARDGKVALNFVEHYTGAAGARLFDAMRGGTYSMID
ncbi:M10 family metallopeptidase C-terminal domain-containing protein [Pseudomonas sp.]|uniref:M10 family metallopeptidase C-terminal domain-containing protein n=1 Tax=unclassified Pseudomonas TaxID=196821 RepID=UPI00198C3DA6|nr:M10 family metallopeptidase C-terminal domain-containing protein [Pseudomonas sp.]MBC6622713.1 M10 family metallopeptidase C-terminal domain-containing protein [Pseudomonas sp.]MBP6956297.1 M10 family metallopeptidase C-terminal domain-containing protein [Pseudomonas sp.]